MIRPPSDGRTQVWSCGGGTQSAAIAALIVMGRLSPPDLAVMVDTEREKSATWTYANAVLIPELAHVGVRLEVVPKSEFATVDLYGLNGDLLLPAYTADGGKMGGFCSNEWKRRVVMRWLRSKGVESCRAWIGYSTDEKKRVKAPREKWIQDWYPLIEMGLSRPECRGVVAQAYWPPPPRSACYICPHMGNAEWRDIRDNAPADFAKAIRVDEMIREEDSNVFLHRSGRPLATADLEAADPQAVLGCDGGDCFV